MEERAFAKINLALHVRGREPDGYHRIETIFAFAQDGDLLSAEPGEGLSLAVDGPFAQGLTAGPDNLVLKAAAALDAAFDVGEGAALRLTKNLPVASGIGGGSADAAAALRLLSRFWRLSAGQSELLDLARPLGADVAACLLSQTLEGRGRGDELRPIELGLSGRPLLLVNPRVPLSTAAVFAAWDGVDRGPIGEGPWRNDLEAPAFRLAPEIGEVLEALRLGGEAELVRMSGSGATCFALYPDEAARGRAAAALPRRWWSLETRLI